jgi:hypothetical protein
MTTTRPAGPPLSPRKIRRPTVSTTTTTTECYDISQDRVLAHKSMVCLGGNVIAAITSLANRDFDVATEGEGRGRKFDYTSGTTTTTVGLTSTSTTAGYHQSPDLGGGRWNGPVARAWEVGAIKCDDGVAVTGGGDGFYIGPRR